MKKFYSFCSSLSNFKSTINHTRNVNLFLKTILSLIAVFVFASASNANSCDNVTSSGIIDGNEYNCGSYDPAMITSVSLPGGGSGTIEYIWLSNSAPSMSGAITIPGANSSTYNPGIITQTTYYRRCARRYGCTDYVGESNWICKVVGSPTCPGAAVSLGYGDAVTSSSGVNSVSNILGAPDDAAGDFYDPNDYAVISLDETLSVGDQLCIRWKRRDYTSSHSGMADLDVYEKYNGNYYYVTTISTDEAKVFVYSNITLNHATDEIKLVNPGGVPDSEVDAIVFCYCNGTCNNVTDGGIIGYNQTGCSPYNVAELINLTLPSGGLGNLEYQWKISTDGGLTSSIIPGANSENYDPGVVHSNTWYQRCSRRDGCTAYDGASNWIMVTITGICPGGSCNNTLISYGGNCDDPNDSFLPQFIDSCVRNVTDLVPANGASNASCDGQIICIASTYNYWEFEFSGNNTATITGLDAQMLYPINMSTAGGQSNSSGCPTTFNYTVKFYLNNVLQETVTGSIPSDVITSEDIDLLTPIVVGYSDDLLVEIHGNPTSTSCDLFELSGLDVKGCCGTICDNVTNGGIIGYDQSGCSPFDVTPLVNLQLPSGGSGSIDYIWKVSYDGGTTSAVIPGATGVTYYPGVVTVDSWYQRCSKRDGCTAYTGESNWIYIDITGACPGGNCDDVIISYGGDCNDGPDSFSPQFIDSCVTGVTDLVPGNGASNASCDDQIICIASAYNYWEFSFTADPYVTIEGLTADMLYPINMSTAGGSSNSSSCATTFSYTVKFFLNNNLVETINGSLPSDQIVTETINLTNPIVAGQNDVIKVEIHGNPTSTSCDLFELAGLEVIGCCEQPCVLTVDAGPDQVTCGANVTLTATASGQDSCSNTVCCPDETLIEWNMDACLSCGADAGDYSEFTPSVSATCMSASGLAMSGSAGHSCIAGVNGTNRAVCILDNNELTLTATFTPNAGETGMLSGLDYYVANPLQTLQMPPCGTWQNGYNITNYTIKVKKNGSTIYTETRTLPNSWTHEVLDFSGNPAFYFNAATTFEFELSTGYVSGNAYFDLDEFKVTGFACSQSQTSSLSYLWSTGATTQSITVNQTGQYIVTVTDCRGCSAMDTVDVNADNISAQVVGTIDVSCFGGSDGSIDLSVVGGTLPYTYLWSNGATTQDVSGLSAGSYTVTVTDASGCTDTKSNILVGEPNDLMANCTSKDVSCDGGMDGGVEVSASGGTAPYTYLWSNGSTTHVVNGLGAGIYTVMVTDANGCTETCSATIHAPSPLNISINTTPVSCFGGSDGAIDITVSGGTPAYTYLWSNGATTEDLMNIPAGAYGVIVTDANGCTAMTQIIMVPEPTDLTANCIATDVTCAGYNDGSVDLTAGGGTPPYTYMWSNGATTEDLNNIGGGVYTVVVTDANGCSETCSATVNEPNPIAITVNVTPVTCNGYSDGAINITVSGGTPAYTFMWSNGATTEDLMNIPAGSYSVVVTDANGCSASTSNIVVIEPSDLTANCVATDALCDGSNDGSVDLTAGGGTPPYTYMWSNGATTEDLNNVGAGTYTVMVTDANGCTEMCSATVNDPTPININVNSTPVSCNGYSDGSIDITVSGGTVPYTFLWSNGATTEDLNGIPAGSYAVVVTDANGCTTTTSNIIIIEPPLLMASCQPTPVTCHGYSDGAVDLTVSGGTPPYTYLWSNGATTEDIANLSGGAYTVNVTDANNCTISCVATVNEPPAIGIIVNVTPVSCNGYSDGAIDITVSGGTPAYTFMWSNGATTEDLMNIPAGSYSVVVTDANGCSASTSNIVVIEPPVLTANCSATDATCHNGTDGSVDLTVGGGTGPYTYMWSNGATTEDLNNVGAGTYTVIVTDANGCTESCNATVNEPPAISVTPSVTNVTCNGYSDGAIDITVSGGTPPYTYLWSNGATTEDVSGLPAGSYSVKVDDANGCTVMTLGIIVTEPPVLVANCTPHHVTCHGYSDGAVNLSVMGGTPPYTYQWSNGATVEDIVGLSGGVYSVVVTDANGCTAQCTVTINEPAPLQITINTTPVSCNGYSDGAIDITVSGGTPAYTFMWSNGATTEDLMNIPAGSYSVVVTDANGCSASTSNIVIVEPPLLTAQCSGTDVTCHGFSDGAVDLTAGGGTAPLTYLWSNGATTEDISNVSAGVYTVTVTDANGCSATCQSTISQPPAISIQVNTTPVTCNGYSDGAINITVSGGTPGYTFMWSNGATTEDLMNIPAGSYSVVVTDANGCSASTSNIVVPEPTPLTANCSPSDVLCNGGFTGAVDLTAGGGTPPYTYMWSNGATTEDISGLAIGSYTVTVTDANGCSETCSATVNQPPMLILIPTKTNVSCHGGSDGAIDITVNGGTPPYTFMWSNGATTEDVSGLTAGTYTVYIMDANQCQYMAFITITEPPMLVAGCIATDALCFGSSDGSVDLTVGGGTPPYTYMWSNGATTEDISGVTAGNYTVTVTDAQGCTESCQATVAQPPAISILINITPVSCNGYLDGAIDITVGGGTPAYTFQWSNGATTEDISGLPAGSYSVVVTDAHGCSASTSNIVVTEPTILTANCTATDASCFNGQDGSIDLTVGGGTPPYTYMWSNGATTEDVNGLAAGTYNVTVTDANGCSETCSATVNEPTDIMVTPQVTDVSCHSGSDGAIDITVSGGTPPYTYLWSNGATTEDISGLTAGGYQVTVTDANGCSQQTVHFLVSQPFALTANCNATDALCNGSTDGSVDLTVGGGTIPYTYSWSNGATTQDLSNVGAGTYTVIVTDANGCTESCSATVNEPPLLTVGVQVTPVSCNGYSDGVIDITVNGGTPAYTFMWSNGATTEDLMNIPAGSYSVVVTDANGCSTSTSNIVIVEPTDLTAACSPTDVSCFGGSDGAVDLTAAGGTPPYTYLWSNGATTEDIGGLSAGIYTVVVTDANGCTESCQATVSQPPALSININVTPVSCNGYSDGGIDITVSGGTPAYTYMWSNGATTEDLMNIPAGNYHVVVTDANGCSASTSNIVVTEPTALTANCVATDATCNGYQDGSVDLTMGGGTPPYTFMWSNGATTEDISGVGAGTYTVTVTDANGCSEMCSSTVNEPALLTIGTNVTPVTCNGYSDGAIDITVSGGTPAYTFLWSNGATTEDLMNIPAGSYSVVVTDANGCTASTSNITITEPTPLTANCSPTDVSCFGGNDGAIDLTAGGGTAPYTYLWSNGATTEDLSGLTAGVYTVVVTDANGCTESCQATIAQPPALSISINTTPVTCNGYSDGAIDITVAGGTPAYTFMWSNGATTEDLMNIPAGNYHVVVTDANGCSASTSNITITEPTALTANCSATDVTCNGGQDGAVDLTAGGGTPPYTYMWSNGATTEDISGLAAGTYTVTVTDANGCSETCSATVNEPPTLLIIPTKMNVSCNGGSDGWIDLSVSGGTPPYTYMWSNGATTEDVSGLSAGTYTVTIADANNCQYMASTSITEPSQLTANCLATDALCNASFDGSVDLTAGGGTAPYTYMWSNGATTEDISGVGASTYTVTVTDAMGCTAECMATVNEPLLLTIGVNVTPVSCNGYSDGAIDITVSGGTPAYTFQWSNGATTEDLQNIPAGSYSVVVTDANGCSASTSNITIVEPSAVTANCSATDATCNGYQDGAVDLTAGGGTGPYTYLWSTGATTEDISGLGAGTYTVTVTDANGCSETCMATVNEPNALSVNINVTPVSCNGYSDGGIDITVSGGTPAYTFMWSNGATTEDLMNIPAGSYHVVVTDANGCTASASNIVVTEPTPVTANCLATDATCNGYQDGSVDLTMGGGTPPYTFMWSNGATTEDITNVGAGTYTVTVSDANGCSTTCMATVNEPPAIGISINVTPASCNGIPDGAINITASGGAPAYTFMWSNGATTEDLMNIPAGNYHVVVTDANGCSASTSSITVTEPGNLQLSTVNMDVRCYGTNTGAIDLTVNGGTAPYTYLWSTGATTEDLMMLYAGIYAVTVTDANGCMAMLQDTLTQPDSLMISGVVTDVSCTGGNDGAIDITVSGGTPPYAFSWSNGATTEDISGLSAGVYTVMLADMYGCITSASFTVGEPSALTANCSATDATCNGYQDGAVDLTAAGGTPPYTYLWSNGATTEDISGVAAGTYTVTVTDANGCSEMCSATVSEPAPIAVIANTTPASCNGGSDGAIDITVSGGTPAYTFMWSNGATTEDLMNIPAGSYTVVVTDANGCTFSTSSITVTEASLLTASCSGTDVSCNGGQDGAVDLTTNGGTPPYTYLWSNGATTEDINGLAAGTYTVTVTDMNGCSATCNAMVSQPPAIGIGANATPVSCNGGSDGAINITVSGGTPGYTFLWSNGATTEDLTNIPAGNYNVVVTDANGCTASTSNITIIEPSALTANCSATDATCNGYQDGAVDLSAGGGTPPYTYMWSNGATSEDIAGLAAGTYTVTVSDANGCSTTCMATVNEPAPITVGASVTPASCNGGSDGAIDITVSGGTPAYTFMWSNGATTEDLMNIPAGTYSVVVTDANGCSASTSSITVTEASLLTANCSGTDASCFGGSDGAVDLTVGGGTAPYTYNWSNGATTEDVSGLSAGTYTVTVTDANGCSATCQATVNQQQPLNIQPTVNDVTCHGGNDGSIWLNVSGGTAPYTYNWSNGATSMNISNLTAGTYTVTVSDAHNCTASNTTVSITVGEPASNPSVGLTQNNVSCFNGSDGSIDATASGGTPPYTYLWSNGATTEDVSGLSAGTYTVTVTDANGCTASASTTITQPNILFAYISSNDVSCHGADDGSADLMVSGGTAPYTYLWSTGATTEDLNNLAGGTYSVTVTDVNGCTTNASTTIIEADTMTFTWSVVDATCDDAMDGSACVVVAGGTAPYTYMWSTGDTDSCAYGLGKGTYPITIIDANGCMIMDTASIIVGAPDPLIASIADTAQICTITTALAGLPHGTIMNNQWNGVTISAVAGMGGADVVAVFNSDTTGTADPDLEVNEGPILTIPEDSIDADNDGLIDNVDDNQFGGLMIFDFDEPVRVNCFTFVDQDINTLPTVTAFDTSGAVLLQVLVPNMGDGSVQKVSMNVSGVARLEIFSITSYAVTHFDIDCGVVQGGCIDGSADLTVSGGTSPYTYLWSNGATTEDLVNVPCATYTVTITDDNGCTMTRSVTIDPNSAAITCDLIPSNSSSCGGTGTATVDNVQGGVAPYTYEWNTNPPQFTQTATGLAPGIYIAVITDANGCTAAEAITVEADPSIQASLSTLPASCFGGADGTVNINITDGMGPFTYWWDDGSTVGSRNDLERGVHSVTVTDVNGCSRTYTQWVNSPSRLRAGGITRKVTCAGSNDGQFEVIVYGGTSPYTFLWNDGATAQNRYNLTKGVYTVTITDANGCDNTIIKWIGQRWYINVGGVQNNVSAPGATDGTATAWGIGGQAPYTYEWNTNPPQTGGTAHNLGVGTYLVKVTDNRGCVRWKSYTIVVDGSGSRNDATALEVEDKLSVKAYPNPTSGLLNLNIESTIESEYRLTILDVTGRVVHNERAKATYGQNMSIVDLHGKSAGVYMLRVEVGDRSQTIRIVLE